MSSECLPPFLAACKRQPVPHTPVWIMRQAGRYLPEYRSVREKVDFLTLTKTPELAAEVTLQPIRRFALDAAILFSDIMTPLESMGLDLDFAPGPVIANPVRTAADVDALRVPNPADSVPFVLETIRLLRRQLSASTPLIGFAGAPFTLFCYVVEGRASKSFSRAKSLLYSDQQTSVRLLEKLTETVATYLEAQADAGAQALMLFDSWAGLLGIEDYRQFARPAVQRILDRLAPLDLPTIYFPNHGATLLDEVATLDVDVVAIDWRLPLSKARQILGSSKAVQGNLDPAALFAPAAELNLRIDQVLAEAGSAPGHIFNLGDGIGRSTDPDAVARMVDYVHERTEGIHDL